MKPFWKTMAALALVALMLGKSYAQDVPALANIKGKTERARVEALIEGARKEGAFEWIGIRIFPALAKQVLTDFKQYYGLNDLRTEYTFTSSGQIISRVQQLLKAKRNNFDVVWTVAWGWYRDLQNQKELMYYKSPKYAEYTLSKKAGMSVDGYWVSDGYTLSPMYNPVSLEKHGLKDFNPTHWKDFTDPRLKGLVSMGNIVYSSSMTPIAQGIEKVAGKKWFTDLAENVKPVLWTKTAQARSWISSDEYPMSLMDHATDAATMRKNNVPVKLVYPEEGVVMLPFAPVILASAPHPNAAKLFIDYVRSAYGTQKMMDANILLFFGRPGVKSKAPDLLPSWENIKLIPFDWDKEETPEKIKAIRNLFRSSGLSH